MKKIIAVAGLVGLLMTGVGFAGEKIDGACRSDVKKLCKDVKPGEGRKMECLQDHKRQVSDECKNNIKERRQEKARHENACRRDRRKFCKDVKNSEGKGWNCLKSHKSELSEECRETLKKKY